MLVHTHTAAPSECLHSCNISVSHSHSSSHLPIFQIWIVSIMVSLPLLTTVCPEVNCWNNFILTIKWCHPISLFIAMLITPVKFQICILYVFIVCIFELCLPSIIIIIIYINVQSLRKQHHLLKCRQNFNEIRGLCSIGREHVNRKIHWAKYSNNKPFLNNLTVLDWSTGWRSI